MEFGTRMSVLCTCPETEREKLLNINYVAHRFGFRLPFCIINCIRDKRRVIASEIINSETRSFPALIAICTDPNELFGVASAQLVYHSTSVLLFELGKYT